MNNEQKILSRINELTEKGYEICLGAFFDEGTRVLDVRVQAKSGKKIRYTHDMNTVGKSATDWVLYILTDIEEMLQ